MYVSYLVNSFYGVSMLKSVSMYKFMEYCMYRAPTVLGLCTYPFNNLADSPHMLLRPLLESFENEPLRTFFLETSHYLSIFVHKKLHSYTRSPTTTTYQLPIIFLLFLRQSNLTYTPSISIYIQHHLLSYSDTK